MSDPASPADSRARTAPEATPRRYRTGQPDVDAAVDALMDLLPREDALRARHARDLVTTAAKLMLEDATSGDVKLLSGAAKELRYAFKVFKPWRHARKVTVFGSARTPAGHPAYELARDFGARMAAQQWMVITGAGGGIMEAAHGGAGREASFGVNIHLPFEQAANETVRGGDKLINFKYFFTRKLTFIKESDAVALFPGGFGTHDEGFETLTLIQTGKTDPLPVVFLEPPGSGYWQEWQAYVERHLRAAGLVSPEDTRLYKVTSDVGEAISEITGFYRHYHSQRYVRDLLVLRLQAELPDEILRELERDFAPVIASGGMEQRGPLPEEANQPEIAHLPRLAFRFTRSDFAALRLLIDRINAVPEDRVRHVARTGPAPDDERAERGATPGERGEPNG